MNKYLIAVVGPTASGKTNTGITIAGYLHTHILSADSRQVYLELNIGTAKPTIDQLASVPHHFINHCSIHQSYAAGQFEMDAMKLLHSIFLHHRTAVISGGSGLFVRAVTDGFDQIPTVSDSIKAELSETFQNKGIATLQQQLQYLDPEYFAIVDKHNPHRLIRALSVIKSTGIPFSQFRTGQKKTRSFSVIKIGLLPDKEKLNNDIDERVNSMINKGLLEEARKLFSFRNLVPLQSVGYQELFDHLEGKTQLEAAIELIKRNTRRFARRQMTWFRQEKDIQWFDPNNVDDILDYILEKMKS